MTKMATCFSTSPEVETSASAKNEAYVSLSSTFVSCCVCPINSYLGTSSPKKICAEVTLAEVLGTIHFQISKTLLFFQNFIEPCGLAIMRSDSTCMTAKRSNI